MTEPTHLCGGRRVLVFGVTFQGWTWSCNWPGVRLGRPCIHTAEVVREAEAAEARTS